MKWISVCETMVQSEDGRYQISRSPKLVHGRYVYRAWLRATNEILATEECVDEAGERAAARKLCMDACEADAVERVA